VFRFACHRNSPLGSIHQCFSTFFCSWPPFGLDLLCLWPPTLPSRCYLRKNSYFISALLIYILQNVCYLYSQYCTVLNTVGGRNALFTCTGNSVLNWKYCFQALKFSWPTRKLFWPPSFPSFSCGPLETWCGPLAGCIAHVQNDRLALQAPYGNFSGTAAVRGACCTAQSATRKEL
jgi:hypothetical protein